MQIHTLPSRNTKKRKRIGRGGKRGTYCGRGLKGQKSRSGASIDPLFEGGRSSLIERMKKVRGFTSPHPKKNIVSLESIDRAFKDGETVSLETLIARGLVQKLRAKSGIKVLGNGKLSKKVIFSSDILFSRTAQDAIKKITPPSS